MGSLKTITALVCLVFLLVVPSNALPKADPNPFEWPNLYWWPGSSKNTRRYQSVIVKVEPSVTLKSSRGWFSGRSRSVLKVPMTLVQAGSLGGSIFFEEASYVRLASIESGPGEASDISCAFALSPDGSSVGMLFSPGQVVGEIDGVWGVVCTSYL